MVSPTTLRFVDLGRQYWTIKAEIDGAIASVLERTDFVLGEEVSLFEAEFAEYCETKFAVGLDSGTSALEMGLRALGIGEGDEVLVPANSFIASASAVSFTGATPVFVDVDPITYNIDCRCLRQHITPRTKAVMPVHLYGQPADMDEVLAVAKRYGLLVIEDACQAHGARYRGRRVGALGHVGAFSFYPGKNLGACGDAGAIVTDDPDIADRVRTMRNCGQRGKYNHVTLAWNRRLDGIQAAVLRVKLRYLDQWNEARRSSAKLYDQMLAGAGVVCPSAPPFIDPVYHLYVIQTQQRDKLQAFLAAEGISTGIHYPAPIHLQPAYAELGYEKNSLPVSEQAASRVLSLPMFAELRPEEVARVADRIHAFVTANPPSRAGSGIPEDANSAAAAVWTTEGSDDSACEETQ